ncbi:MAG TPA: hypothetical protein VJU78_01195 [Chitinophagaceae bacterium]|nr:hypothetical protein [Chitinophagaceae bacterium]
MTKSDFEFEYLDDHYQKMKARVTAPFWPSTSLTQTGTQDPLWEVHNPASATGWYKPGDNGEYLTLFGTDGALWKTRIHAEYNGITQKIRLWFESKTRDQETGNNPTMGIVDWHNDKWHVLLPNEIYNHQRIKFTLQSYK